MGFSLGVLELCSAAGERQRAWRKYGLSWPIRWAHASRTGCITPAY